MNTLPPLYKYYGHSLSVYFWNLKQNCRYYSYNLCVIDNRQMIYELYETYLKHMNRKGDNLSL